MIWSQYLLGCIVFTLEYDRTLWICPYICVMLDGQYVCTRDIGLEYIRTPGTQSVCTVIFKGIDGTSFKRKDGRKIVIKFRNMRRFLNLSCVKSYRDWAWRNKYLVPRSFRAHLRNLTHSNPPLSLDSRNALHNGQQKQDHMCLWNMY